MSESGLLKWYTSETAVALGVDRGRPPECGNEAWLSREYRPGGDLKFQVSSLLLGAGGEFTGSSYA